MMNNNYKGSNNHNNSGRQNQEKKPLTCEEIKKKYFSKTYDKLLLISTGDKEIPLDDIFKDINAFVEKGFLQKSLGNKKIPYISTTQLRNVYAKMVPIKAVNDIKMLRPNLAYIAARQNTKEAKEIIDFLDGLIKEIKDLVHLESFKKVMEAIVAYHKYHYNN